MTGDAGRSNAAMPGGGEETKFQSETLSKIMMSQILYKPLPV